MWSQTTDTVCVCVCVCVSGTSSNAPHELGQISSMITKRSLELVQRWQPRIWERGRQCLNPSAATCQECRGYELPIKALGM